MALSVENEVRNSQPSTLSTEETLIIEGAERTERDIAQGANWYDYLSEASEEQVRTEHCRAHMVIYCDDLDGSEDGNNDGTISAKTDPYGQEVDDNTPRAMNMRDFVRLDGWMTRTRSTIRDRTPGDCE